MLKEIKFIENIGRFETTKSTYGATFSSCTLVFGENGWGKSTLSDILRSLTTNNPAIIAGRTTVDANAPPKAVLRFGTQNAVFENGTWTGPHPRIAVYDSAFINANVFSGDVVSADHLRNQYGLVVGEEGVRRVRRIVELDVENRINNAAIRTAEGELNAVIRTVAPPAMSRDDFLALDQRTDIDDAIAAQDARVQQARRARELKVAAEPTQFAIPTETAKLRDLLDSAIDEVAEHALAKVRAHIAAHECGATEGDAAHESWLEAGMVFLREDQCPFCGQPLTDRALVDAYKDFFSAAYKRLGAAVKKARDTFERYKAGEFRAAVSQVAQQNAGHFQYWHEAGKLTPPDVPRMDAIIARIEDAAARLDALFAAKQANLIEAVSGAEAEAAFVAWDDGRNQITAINAKVEAFLGQIKALKDSIDPAALPRLESELKALQAAKRRHEDDIITLAVRLDECQSKREAITGEKAKLRTELDEHGRAITTELGTAINTYCR